MLCSENVVGKDSFSKRILLKYSMMLNLIKRLLSKATSVLIVSFTNPIASGLVKLNTSVFVSCVTLEECKSLMQTQNDQNLLYESSSKFKIKYLYFIVSLL